MENTGWLLPYCLQQPPGSIFLSLNLVGCWDIELLVARVADELVGFVGAFAGEPFGLRVERKPRADGVFGLVFGHADAVAHDLVDLCELLVGQFVVAEPARLLVERRLFLPIRYELFMTCPSRHE